MAHLIIVSGPSASGKSVLAGKLAADLPIAVLKRDEIKEALFDSLGYSDRQRSIELGGAAATVLNRMATTILSCGVNCLIEGKFNPKFSNDELNEIVKDTGAEVLQVQCISKGETLVERFATRVASGERHPGHAETDSGNSFEKELLAGSYPHLDVPGKTLIYDTSTFSDKAYATLLKEVSHWLEA